MCLTARVNGPWEPDDHREPLNVYGLTKYEGEIAVEQNVEKYLYCPHCLGIRRKRKEFHQDHAPSGQGDGALSALWMTRLVPLLIPTIWPSCLVDMIQTDKYGRYHATNEGLCSWYEFACEIFRQAGMDEVKVTPVDSVSFPC